MGGGGCLGTSPEQSLFWCRIQRTPVQTRPYRRITFLLWWHLVLSSLCVWMLCVFPAPSLIPPASQSVLWFSGSWHPCCFWLSRLLPSWQVFLTLQTIEASILSYHCCCNSYCTENQEHTGISARHRKSKWKTGKGWRIYWRREG